MDTLRATEIFSQAGLCLIAIESADLQQSKTELGYHIRAHLAPLALIVCTSDEIFAFDMQAQPIAVEHLVENIPELKNIITSFKCR